MEHDLLDGHPILVVASELGDVVDDGSGNIDGAVAHERPNRAGHHGFGRGVEGVAGRGIRFPKGLFQNHLPLVGERHLAGRQESLLHFSTAAIEEFLYLGFG